jgi:hypothetical protein
MAGVVNDIEALAEFRAHLMRFNHDLAENFATIQAHWRELGEIWRDDMYRLFGEALDEVMPGIATYLSATEGHEAHLAALIERLTAFDSIGTSGGVFSHSMKCATLSALNIRIRSSSSDR